jgi:hypothetical protein
LGEEQTGATFSKREETVAQEQSLIAQWMMSDAQLFKVANLILLGKNDSKNKQPECKHNTKVNK